MSKNRRRWEPNPTAANARPAEPDPGSDGVPASPRPVQPLSGPPARLSEPQPSRPASSQRPRDRSGFNPDYSYVFKDLRRIARLAGGLIALLILLSFFLR